MAAGPIALIGGEGFTEGFRPALLKLADISGGERAHVAVLPTAAADDGEGVPARRAKIALDYFSEIGVQAEAVMVVDQTSANDPQMVAKIKQATWIHLAGGQTPVLHNILDGSAVWKAILQGHNEGKLLVGSSAGAVVLGEHAFAPRRPYPPRMEDIVFEPSPAFNLLPGLAIGPHYNAALPHIREQIRAMLPPGVLVVGIDEATALLGQADTWQVMGAGNVTLIRDGVQKVYPSGAVVPLLG